MSVAKSIGGKAFFVIFAVFSQEIDKSLARGKAEDVVSVRKGKGGGKNRCGMSKMLKTPTGQFIRMEGTELDITHLTDLAKRGAEGT